MTYHSSEVQLDFTVAFTVERLCVRYFVAVSIFVADKDSCLRYLCYAAVNVSNGECKLMPTGYDVPVSITKAFFDRDNAVYNWSVIFTVKLAFYKLSRIRPDI